MQQWQMNKSMTRFSKSEVAKTGVGRRRQRSTNIWAILIIILLLNLVGAQRAAKGTNFR